MLKFGRSFSSFSSIMKRPVTCVGAQINKLNSENTGILDNILCSSHSLSKRISSVSNANHFKKIGSCSFSHQNFYIKRNFFGKSKSTEEEDSINAEDAKKYATKIYNTIHKVDVIYYFKLLSLPDTLYSWYLITELHVWLISARLTELGVGGTKVRDLVIAKLWQDLEYRISKIGEIALKKTKNLRDIYGHFQESLLYYDDGLLGSDKELASALWNVLLRNEYTEEFYEVEIKEVYNMDELHMLIMEPNVDPRVLESLVQFVRKQIHLFDQLDKDKILSGDINWVKPEKISAL